MLHRAEYAWQTCVKDQKYNLRLTGDVSKQQFVVARNERDTGLVVSRLSLLFIPVNIRAGRIPKAEKIGVHHLLVSVKSKTSELVISA